MISALAISTIILLVIAGCAVAFVPSTCPNCGLRKMRIDCESPHNDDPWGRNLIREKCSACGCARWLDVGD